MILAKRVCILQHLIPAGARVSRTSAWRLRRRLLAFESHTHRVAGDICRHCFEFLTKSHNLNDTKAVKSDAILCTIFQSFIHSGHTGAHSILVNENLHSKCKRNELSVVGPYNVRQSVQDAHIYSPFVWIAFEATHNEPFHFYFAETFPFFPVPAPRILILSFYSALFACRNMRPSVISLPCSWRHWINKGRSRVSRAKRAAVYLILCNMNSRNKHKYTYYSICA